MSPSFEEIAGQWLAWARTPGHDAYWHYRDALFALLPAPGGASLDVGCGEGRVTRDLRDRGYAVTGLDASLTLVAAAREQDAEGGYVVGDAAALPFPDGGFALVVAYNALMDVDDLPRTVAEIGRVLAPGGCLCACVTHPTADAGGWEDGRYVLTRSYRHGGPFHAVDERDGLTMTFTGHRRSLEEYSRALEPAGLAIEAIREAGPAHGAPEHYAPWDDVPMFLQFRARRIAPARSPGTSRTPRP